MRAYYEGKIQGNRGSVKRAGTKHSGFTAWAQTGKARITISLDRTLSDDKDMADIVFGSGPNEGHGSYRISINDLESFVAALDTNDPTIKAAWKRIERDIGKIDRLAKGAVQKAKRKQEREKARQQRWKENRYKQQLAIVRALKPEEKARLERLGVTEWDHEGNPVSLDWMDMRNLRYADDKPDHVMVIVKLQHQMFSQWEFDVTEGQWVLPFEPGDLGIEEYVNASGFGYRIYESKEVSDAR